VLFDPEGSWKVRHADMLHAPRWSQVGGRSITGFVVRTLRRGKTIYDAERHDDASRVGAGSGVVLTRAM
jgi:dihydroorotase-like cyclic amidohydrolase